MLGKGEIQAEIRRMQLQISNALFRADEEAERREELERKVRTLQQQQASTPPGPSANQLWNGELGHSVNSWHDLAYVTTDVAKECAFWFSNAAMTVGQALTETDARTSPTNKTLKALAYAALTDHSTYDSNYSDWAAIRGLARFQNITTIDTPLPNNSIEPGMTVFVNMICAKRTSYIEIPDTMRFFAGIFDNTAGQRDWLTGSVGLSAAAATVGGTTEHRYRLYIETDRGYSILSNEVTVADGFSDAQFAAGSQINLEWLNAAGYIRVQIWRYTPSTGAYKVLDEFSNGASTYIDINTYLNIIPAPTGYPTGTDTDRKAIFWTTSANLVDLVTDGGVWDAMHCPILVPDNYDKSNTTDRQWLRLGTDVACDLFVENITTDGTTNVTAPDAVFESDYSSLFPGKTVQILDENDALILTTTVSSRSSDTVLILAATCPAGSNRKLRVVGAGFHGILVDKIHLGFQDNVSFAPNALDSRALQPVAAPSSGQGGTVGGSGGSGGGLCVVENTMVAMNGGDSLPVQKLEYGNYVEGENSAPNMLAQLDAGFRQTRIVRTKNGFEIEGSNSHRFKLNAWDFSGTAIKDLRVGDSIETKIDGKHELSRITHIGDLSQEKKAVYTPRLKGGQYYIAGQWKPTFWQKILIKLKLMKPKRGGVYCHNRKPFDGDIF